MKAALAMALAFCMLLGSAAPGLALDPACGDGSGRTVTPARAPVPLRESGKKFRGCVTNWTIRCNRKVLIS